MEVLGFFFLQTIILEQVKVYHKIEKKIQDIPCTPFPYVCTAPSLSTSPTGAVRVIQVMTLRWHVIAQSAQSTLGSALGGVLSTGLDKCIWQVRVLSVMRMDMRVVFLHCSLLFITWDDKMGFKHSIAVPGGLVLFWMEVLTAKTTTFQSGINSSDF